MIRVLLIACLPCCVLTAGCNGSASPPPIYLGHVATTSGPNRLKGQHEAWGMRLAAEDWAKDQVTLLERPIHVKHTDARGSLDAFESQAVRLASLSRVLALYGGNTPDEAVRLDRAAAVLVTPLGYRPRSLSERAFAIGMSPSLQGKALAQFALQGKKVKQAAVLVDEGSEAAQQLAEALEREFSAVEGARLEKIALPKDAIFAKLADRVPAKSVLFFTGPAQDLPKLREAFPDASLLFFAGDDGPPPGNRDKQPIYFATAFTADAERSGAQEFVKRFRAAFQDAPDVHAALAYEGARLIVDAARRAHPQVAERFLDELRKTKDFAGLSGPMSFGKDQVLRRPVFVAKSEAGAVTTVKRYESE